MDVSPSALKHLIIEDFFFKVSRQGEMKLGGGQDGWGVGGIWGGGGGDHHDDHPESDNDSTPVTLT